MMSKATPNLLSEALALHQAGRLPQAAARYRKVLQAVPDEPNALRLLGVIELQSGDLDAAERLFARAIKARPTSADSHYFAGRVAVARNDAAAAEGHFHVIMDGGTSYASP